MKNTSEKEQINEMLDAIMKVARGDYSTQVELSGKNDNLDSLAIGLNMMIDDIKTRTVEFEYVNNRTEKIIEAIQRVASGDFGAVCEVSDKRDIFDALAAGTNMMIEEISDGITQLEKSEERYRDLFENSSELIQSVTPDGRFIYVNRAWREALGYNQEKIMALSMFDIIHPECHAHCMNVFKQVISGETVDNVETVFVTSNGEKIIVEGNVNCRFVDGKPVSTRGIFRDITGRKKAEESLKESEEKYRTLFKSSRDAIMMLAPPTWKFTAGNPSTVSMFNAKEEFEFISKGPWDVSPEYQPDGQLSSDKAKQMIDKAMKQGSNFFEWTHKRIDGEEFPTTVLLTKIKLESKELLQATVRDITERKKAEEALRKAHDELEMRVRERTAELGKANEILQKEINVRKKTEENLRIKNRELNTFVYKASHDLRAPFASISGLTHLAKNNIKDPASFEYLDLIEISTNRLDNMLKDLVEISTVMQGVVEKEPVNIEKFVNEVIDSLKHTPQARDVDFRLNFSQKKKFVSDPKLLTSVLQNLIDNAAKYNTSRTKDHYVEIKAQELEEGIRFNIIDNGDGIPKKFHNKVFDMFFRASEESKGTGLGLYIVKTNIEKLGGTIKMKSQVGIGTRFTIYLPG
ncbi:MAG: PAS domain S-box protein [Bacteroidota bacterium]